jgi:hypothetical protein
MKKGKFRILSDGLLAFYCPGCKQYHGVHVDKSKPVYWDFNGDYDKPTFSPSLHITIGHYPDPPSICHSFVKDGNIQFLSDCTHKLAGQTVELENEEE